MLREAVGRVAAGGAHVVVATGRSLHGTLPVCSASACARASWCAPTAAVTVQLDPAVDEGYRVVSLHTFDPSGVAELLREHLPAGLFATEVLGRGYKLTAPFPEGELTGDMQIVPFDELFAEPVMRVIIRSPEHTSAEFSRLVDEVGLHGVAYSVGWTAWLDLAPDGVTKASALEEVRLRLDVDPGRTLAVGDGRNDVEMLRWAGRASPWATRPPRCRRAADEVTGTVDEDGLAQVLEGLLAVGPTA